MKAIQFIGKGQPMLAEIPEPRDLPSGHVLIKIRASGLCHTDIDVLHGRYGAGAFPVVPGHEFAGEIKAIAGGVTNLNIGDRVVVDPNLPCGTCAACRNGMTNLCIDLKAYGVTQDGGFAEFCAVHCDQVHPVGNLSFDVAALAEPLACALNGIGAAGFGPEALPPSDAIIFGAGPIGLLLALSLKSRGAQSVTMADVNHSRLEFAAGLGLKAVRSDATLLTSRRREFDFVADATGVPSVVQDMIQLVADGGTALLFGVCAPDATVSILPFEVFRRQLKIVGSHSLNRNIPEAIAMLETDDGSMAKLVSHRLPLEEMLKFFLAKPSDPATMKIQFVSD
ncbi:MULTISPECIES: zinc-dependent alcohol dehydrogenase family protein [Agrobacterium]|uniref:Zinc-dependent alcohol dehydrogenase family protein n=1 Tax=Agrobacterium rubi TaxID=28099 RepID=A0AAE7US03_9HYPH|nr:MULTISPECIES: zinc-dependent alcohol dehydrogenase family protein [Agrobacterium]MBN7807807.1 zinc-dependent alcohol dehydrogenase family protein [Agrobacterium rosae]NTE89766.1 zinc-dependent alcohol dehydrogenase family protein [Agrobacterium rubi]NTF05384.1 zinc-dependent alcohol dehydrogenase family protein [Agrobacterium rubi]NTF39828.1 zinc-dependent alcohol dehydrogenase family protein [Agrobacterium rubi]OCJ44865.1 zinc-binding dehydrogenase [Agrobacterium rubi]